MGGAKKNPTMQWEGPTLCYIDVWTPCSLDRWLLSGNIVSIIREKEDRLATSQAPRDYVYTGLY